MDTATSRTSTNRVSDFSGRSRTALTNPRSTRAVLKVAVPIQKAEDASDARPAKDRKLVTSEGASQNSILTLRVDRGAKDQASGNHTTYSLLSTVVDTLFNIQIKYKHADYK